MFPNIIATSKFASPCPPLRQQLASGLKNASDMQNSKNEHNNTNAEVTVA
jgi:hypothetical protein